MKKILMILALLVMMISCGTTVKLANTTHVPSHMVEVYSLDVTQFQMDSIVVADTLPPLNRWVTYNIQTYRRGDIVHRKMYIRNYPSGNMSRYVVTGVSEPYNISKTITY